LLSRHGKKRWGPPTAEDRARLDALAEEACEGPLREATARFHAASGWGELLAGLEPTPGPGDVWERDFDETFAGLFSVHYAPLTKGAIHRLPEAIRRADEVIERMAKSEKEKGIFWYLFYCSMGAVTTAEEADRLLADKLVYIHDLPQCRNERSATSTAWSS
jgi:hypothetical protein